MLASVPPMRQAGFWRLLDLADVSELQALVKQTAEKLEGIRPPMEDSDTINAMLWR